MPFLQMVLNLPFLLAGFLIKLLFFCKKGMGGAYLKGLVAGIRLSAGKKGRSHRVKFSFSHLKNYVWIQGQLWVNMVRRF